MYAGQPQHRFVGHATRILCGSVMAMALISLLVGCSSTATGSPSTTLATATSSSYTQSTATAAATGTATSSQSTATPTPNNSGTPHLQSTMLFHTFAHVAAHSNTSIVDISCPSGYLVAGGGPSNADPTYVMLWDAPISTTTWQAEVYNTGSTSINAQVNVICYKLSGLQSLLKIGTYYNIAPNTNSSINDISCPAGYLVSGGGVNIGYTTYTLMQNAPISGSIWRGEFYNTSSSQTISAQIQVICLKAQGLQSQIQLHAFNGIAANNGTLYTQVSCPSGYLVAGGGVATGYPALHDQTDAPASTTTWGVQYYNSSGSPINAQTQFLCFKLA
jgi:hypothetical protein